MLVERAAELADPDIVEEIERFGALHGNVVDAVVHDIVADRVVLLHHHGDHELRTDTVDAGDQNRLFVLREIELEETAEPADRSEQLGPPRFGELLLDLVQQ